MKKGKDMLNADLQRDLTEDAKPVIHGKRVQNTDKTNITYFVSPEMHMTLKRAAVDHNTSLQQLIDEAVDLLFAKYALGSFVPLPSKKRKQ